MNDQKINWSSLPIDISEIRVFALKIRWQLRKEGILTPLILLYGSYARGTPREDSDIDLAVISDSYGFNRFDEGVHLNLLAFDICPLIEAVPISLDKYLEVDTISPLLHEIKKEGIPLF